MSETISFVWQNWDGSEETISYDPAEAAIPLLVDRRPDGTTAPLPVEAEHASLCNTQASFHHWQDEAARAGRVRRITDADRAVLSRIHWMEQQHAELRG